MYRIATRGLIGLIALTIASPAQDLRLDWRHIGNSAIHHQLGDVATGPVDRVWYTGDGSLAIRTQSAAIWTTNGEGWKQASAPVPVTNDLGRGGRAYRIDGDVFRSDDGGKSWINLTSYRGTSLLGGAVADLAVSPQNPDEIVAVNANGVWKSMDAGETWAGLNQDLPNLSISRIVATPNGVIGVRAVAGEELLEWTPGQKVAWSPVAGATPSLSIDLRIGAYLYRAEGATILVQRDGAAQPPIKAPGTVTRFWADPKDGVFALATAGKALLRTLNGGLTWDDITGALPEGTLNDVTADRLVGAIYVAGDQGVFYGTLDFNVAGQPPVWRKLTGLPAATTAVRLDQAANQIFVAVEGYGVFATLAPHRRRLPSLVSAADLVNRSASPGALLTLLGAGVTSARSGDRVIPLLASSEGESQLQVPFEAQGSELALRLESSATRWNMTLPLDAASPAIFVDRDGSPMLLDGASGVLLDAMNPARSSARLQILATGLGRVQPEWPTGLEAPLTDPPSVVAPVKVFLDGQPLEVTRATLAPGYIGFYLVEAEMPALVNAGTAELRLEVNRRPSNSVRVYIEP